MSQLDCSLSLETLRHTSKQTVKMSRESSVVLSGVKLVFFFDEAQTASSVTDGKQEWE